MIIDHIGYFFFPEMQWLRLIGRIAFPIFLFLVGFSWNYKRRRDLLIIAILVQIPITIVYRQWDNTRTLNILFSIIIARIFLSIYQKIDKHYIFIILICIFAWTSLYTNKWFDYWWFALLFPLLGYFFKIHKEKNIYKLLYSISIFLLFLWYTTLTFWFTINETYILTLFFIFLLYTFFLLWQQNYKINLSKKWDSIILRIAKNSLYIYIIHLLLLSSIKIFLSKEGKI